MPHEVRQPIRRTYSDVAASLSDHECWIEVFCSGRLDHRLAALVGIACDVRFPKRAIEARAMLEGAKRQANYFVRCAVSQGRAAVLECADDWRVVREALLQNPRVMQNPPLWQDRR